MLLILIIGLASCVDKDEFSDFDLSSQEVEVAIPLVNTKISVGKLSEISKNNTSLKIASDGKATILYNGEVIRKNSATIFPPFPGLIAFPITDTITNVLLPVNNTYLLKKSIFSGTNINFYFENALKQDVRIKMSILELSKNGLPFEREFIMKAGTSGPSKLQTEQISVDGWILQTNSNSMTFYYEAFLPDGQKIKLDLAQMGFDVIKFAYIEGYLGYHVFDVDGNIINIGLFDQWISGTFDFADPKISLSVDNTFGLP
ncbi:MAG: hypothetical protein WAU01_00100, partial [Saprospiraceae bacterium]